MGAICYITVSTKIAPKIHCPQVAFVQQGNLQAQRQCMCSTLLPQHRLRTAHSSHPHNPKRSRNEFIRVEYPYILKTLSSQYTTGTLPQDHQAGQEVLLWVKVKSPAQ